MTLRERLYGQLLSRYGPPPLQYSVVAVSIGAKGRELPRVSAAVEAIIHFFEDVSRPQNLLMRWLAPPILTPPWDPVQVTQQILDDLEQERRVQTESLAASGCDGHKDDAGDEPNGSRQR